jgi:hypothetical protein
MKCPICGTEAQEIEPGMGDFHTVRCPQHGEFQFSDTLRADTTPRTVEQWERALAQARESAAPGARPRITSCEF